MQFIQEIHIKPINFFALFYKGMLLSFVVIISVFFSPMTTNAGLFSFLMGATGDEVSAKTVEQSTTSTSQNMLVLEAVVNRDPNSNSSSNDGPLMSGNALVAEIGPSGTVSDIEEKAANTQISLYVVREGDTLAKIADMFDVSVNTIMWANDVSRSSSLREGQKLVILPISGLKYSVKKGDTIKGIVTRYKTDLDEVLQYNDLTLSSVLSVGDIIVIPDAEPFVAPQSPVKRLSKKVNSNFVHDSNGPFYPGYYIRPIDGGYKSQGLHGYNAVDIAVSVGTPIRAAAEGTVIASVTGGWHGGYGNYVIVSHPNGTQTLYAHNSKNFVSVGSRVQQGQMIAKVGSTGNSTGPHVHFEIRGAKNTF